MADERLRVYLIAHEVHPDAGMERSMVELIRRSPSIDWVVLSRYIDPDLRSAVTWWRIWAPARPFIAKFCVFWLIAGIRTLSARGGIRHSCGAIVPNRVDVATVHFCHAAYRRHVAPGSLEPRWWLRGYRRLLSWLVTSGEHWCYGRRRPPTLMCVSAGVAEECRECFPRARTSLTPNGVDLDRFYPSPARRSRYRGLVACRAEAKLIVFAGGDWVRKGLDVVIEAVAMLERSDVMLLVVGPGREHDFRELARRRHIENRVIFVGGRPDIEGFLSASDLYVLASAYETFSMATYEAAASGLPIVSTPVHGVADLLSTSGCGILCDRDPVSVAAALESLLASPSQCLAMGQAGVAAASQFTWERAVGATTDAYRAVAVSRPELA